MEPANISVVFDADTLSLPNNISQFFTTPFDGEQLVWQKIGD
jgi:hypothetical protein